jgi:hypothetical protein
MAIKDQLMLRGEMDILEDEMNLKHVELERLGHEWPELERNYRKARRVELIKVAQSSAKEH